ncbi:MAG: SirB1 family protein, partial [Bryobacteraceae bacterium]
MTEIADLLAGRGTDLELDRAALLLATIEYPDLDIRSFLELLDSHAAELGARVNGAGGEAFVRLANRYLFAELGFHGNTSDYYNPSNSCLNDVLTNRTGIPITLSVVYMEIARRLSKPVLGIGLPGHFVVRYDDGNYATFIDPFHGGRLLGPAECIELARAAAGANVAPLPGSLAPVDNRQIVARMINNLRGIYFSRRAYRKALSVLNLLLEADPSSAGEYKQRALLHIQMEQMRAA